MSPVPRGALIVIEGLDRAGKSTQCEKLCRYLEQEGRRVKHMRFPNRSTPIGKSIDSYLRGETQQEDHVIHLLFSANRWEAAPQIIEYIDNGITVVIDRYYYSGAVYSAAKNNPNLTLDWAIQPEIGLPKPDLCIFLDVSPTDAAARGGFGSERYETSEMQKRVRNLFQELLQKPQNREMVAVDAGESMEEVHRAMRRLGNKLFEGEGLSKPLKSFHYH
ncbi:Thymidylate kinase [Xanthoria calcicola]